jgi:tetratricopeptide (TPR) repeat protein
LASAQRTPQESADVAEDVAVRAREHGDEQGELLARAVAAYYRTRYEPDPRIDELEALTHEALSLLEEADDHAGLMHAWCVLAFGVTTWRGQQEQFAEATEQALRHARIAGQDRGDLLHMGMALCLGPRPADEALRTLEELAAASTHPLPALNRGWLLAMLGRFEEAWPVARDAAERMEGTNEPHVGWFVLGEIARLDGDARAAADHLQRFCESLEQRGERNYLYTFGPLLGRDLCRLGRADEGELWAKLGREPGAENDVTTQALWRQAQALVEAARGRLAEADSLAREAVALMERTDSLSWQGDALGDLAEVLELYGRRDEAAAALEQALERYERKKNLAMVAQVRPKLEALRDSVPR